jgi:hypothetical protein
MIFGAKLNALQAHHKTQTTKMGLVQVHQAFLIKKMKAVKILTNI